MRNKLPNYQELYQRYYSPVYRQLIYLLADPTVAQDITQEVFLKLYSSPPHEFQNIGGWLSRVATHLAYNYLRGEKSRRNREEKSGLPDQAVQDAGDEALRNVEAQYVRQVLDMLSDRDRLCLLMKHSGFTYGEIAAAAGLKISSVGTTVARAQAKFKQAYLRQKGSDGRVL
jgi:RNA polymerase sigma factor (sigma-70 family)